MTVKPRGNVSSKPLRWTVEAASREFKLAANTLRKILNQGGAEPDQGGCFSTQQICECLYGDLKAERLRKERELTKRYQLENEITEATVVNRSELANGLAGIADAMTSRIMASELGRPAKEDLLAQLSSIPLTLQEVADKQTRLPRGKGKRPEED